MVSLRCIDIVRAKLDRLKIVHGAVGMGTVQLDKTLTAPQRKSFRIALRKFGFVLLDNNKDRLIEKIKKTISDIVDKPVKRLHVNHSVYISKKLDYSYTYLANIFSEITGGTIEHAIINQKIEKVKELMLYDTLSLTQISRNLNYSSVAHLSKQFKQVTGLTPTFFKKMKEKFHDLYFFN
jgi:methylphosphotriester-DNA--protein-cysteine methyltransferase